MADPPPPPYPGADQGPSYPPGDTTKQPIPPDGPGVTGYPPQTTPGYPTQPGPANPQTAYPPQPIPGYPPQPTAGYPPQPTAGYPTHPGHPSYPQHGHDQNKGYAPVATGYPPPGQGYIQQPAGYTATNTNTTVVVTQQPTIATAVVMPYVNDYMGLSIFSCLCCCWCIGLFAIIKSSEARSNYNAGNYTQALASATSARNLSYVSIFCGIGVIILAIIVSSV